MKNKLGMHHFKNRFLFSLLEGLPSRTGMVFSPNQKLGMNLRSICLFFVFPFLLSPAMLKAQYTTDKLVGKKNEAEIDSLKSANYPYMLPIWGEKVVRKGFELPYSAGLSMQYLWQQSDLIIDNLQIGFNDGPKYNLDELVRFEKAVATSNGINFRPDFWLFPFLNIYGIFAKSKTSTAIQAGVWIPDSSTWHKILDINTKASFDATTYGFGLTPTIGIGGFFLAIDMNFTWTDIKELEKPAYAFIFGPRFGKNFNFKKPGRGLAVWAGGFRVKLDNGTSGSLNTSELFPTDQWQSNIDTGYAKVASSQANVDTWWNNLSPMEQKNPVNIAKYETANSALATAGNILDQASQVVTNAAGSTIQYSLDKRPKDMWNFIIGAQFQLNKSWMLRAEYGFLGTRQQLIAGLQYRFGL
jgi:hypothetical protein